MPYQLLITPAAQRSIKKLPSNIKAKLLEEIRTLVVNPMRGEVLRKEFKGLLSLHLKIVNTQYRVVYKVDNQACVILILYAATRENFYKELKRLMY